METKEIQGMTVTAKVWENKRIYFQVGKNCGAACWDINAREFVKVRCQVGVKFQNAIAEAFNL